jgi:serine protease Do
MKKFQVLLIILLATFFALAIQILFGNFLSARLATWPVLRNLDLFNPRAPIVVTNRETVRVSDADDAVETTNAIKSKLATVVYYEGTGENARLITSGGAVNWTSDGYFVTSRQAMSVANKTYAVVLNSGDIYPIKEVYFDPASNLAILATDARNLAAVEPVDADSLRPGEKILLIQNSVGSNKTTFLESYLQKFASDVSGQYFSSDRVGRSLVLQSVGPISPGQAAVNLDGRLAGMWDGTTVVSADAIRLFAENYFRNNKQVLRPGYGFTYVQLSGSEARALQLAVGARVTPIPPGGPNTAIAPGSSAAVSGLQTGDIITSVNGQKVDDDHFLESLLASQNPGDAVTLGVSRDNQPVTIVITPRPL